MKNSRGSVSGTEMPLITAKNILKCAAGFMWVTEKKYSTDLKQGLSKEKKQFSLQLVENEFVWVRILKASSSQ